MSKCDTSSHENCVKRNRHEEIKDKEEKEPFWKRRILSDTDILRKDLNGIETWFPGRWKKI